MSLLLSVISWKSKSKTGKKPWTINNTVGTYHDCTLLLSSITMRVYVSVILLTKNSNSVNAPHKKWWRKRSNTQNLQENKKIITRISGWGHTKLMSNNQNSLTNIPHRCRIAQSLIPCWTHSKCIQKIKTHNWMNEKLYW